MIKPGGGTALGVLLFDVLAATWMVPVVDLITG